MEHHLQLAVAGHIRKEIAGSAVMTISALKKHIAGYHVVTRVLARAWEFLEVVVDKRATTVC